MHSCIKLWCPASMPCALDFSVCAYAEFERSLFATGFTGRSLKWLRLQCQPSSYPLEKEVTKRRTQKSQNWMLKLLATPRFQLNVQLCKILEKQSIFSYRRRKVLLRPVRWHFCLVQNKKLVIIPPCAREAGPPPVRRWDANALFWEDGWKGRWRCWPVRRGASCHLVPSLLFQRHSHKMVLITHEILRITTSLDL